MEEIRYRIATVDDWPEVMDIRLSVRENRLANPSDVTITDYTEMITKNGIGWVCELKGKLIGFSIIDMSKKNIWALFLLPAYEGKGIGKKLLQFMVDYAFEKGVDELWLGTELGSRAEEFYKRQGWKKIGIRNNDLEAHMILSNPLS